jgi:hypothetical protein
MRGGVCHQRTPAAADVEQPHARPEIELAADQIQFGLLRLVEGAGVFPIAAAIGHAWPEHRLIEIVSQIIVDFAHPPGAAGVLAVENPRHQDGEQKAQRLHLAVQPRAQDSFEKPVESRRIPVSIHVGLAQSEVAARSRPLQHTRFVDPHVPRPAAADADPRLGQKVLDFLAKRGFPAARRQGGR